MARNLLGIRHIERSDIEELLALSAELKLRVVEGKSVPKLSDKVAG